MNCRELQNSLRERVGKLIPEEAEKEHLAGCASCRALFAELMVLEGRLGAVVEPLSPQEFAVMQAALDKRIDAYFNRALRFYRFAVRYGTSLAAVILVVMVSLTGQISRREEPAAISTEAIAEKIVMENVSATEIDDEAETISLDESYLKLIIDNYMAAHGNNGGESILGELEEAEWDHARESMIIEEML